MTERLRQSAGTAALVLSMITLVLSFTGLADAARHAITKMFAASATPHPGGLLLLGKTGKFPASVIPATSTATAKNATELSGKTLGQLTPSCAPTTVDLGTWCLDTSPYPLTNLQAGENNYFFASQTCVAAGGWLPTAAQLIGAASRVKLESTIGDSPLTATVDIDPADGLKDGREMSSTLVTTAAGSDAAGSEGVSTGSTGNPATGEPNPVPQPAVPEPQTLQYVTVYSNATKGGFAGSEPVSTPENFRCAYNKAIGAAQESAA
jgi:hypothetical protein